MEYVGYVLDVLDLRKLQIETWVVFDLAVRRDFVVR